MPPPLPGRLVALQSAHCDAASCGVRQCMRETMGHHDSGSAPVQSNSMLSSSASRLLLSTLHL